MLALLLGLLLLVSIGCLAVVVLRPGDAGPGIARRDRARAREERLAAEWADTMQLLRARPHLTVIEVGNTYQRARRGTKAIVRWADSGASQDTWFWYDEWAPGTLLIVNPSVGWGPHNRNPSVLYLEKERVVARVDPRAAAAAAAVERRRREQETDEAA